MKIWKALLGLAALVAVTPYSVKKDEETGEVKVKTLTWNASYTPKSGDAAASLQVNLLPEFKKSEEEEVCCEAECCCGEEESEEAADIEVTIEIEKDAEPEEPAAPETPAEPELA